MSCFAHQLQIPGLPPSVSFKIAFNLASVPSIPCRLCIPNFLLSFHCRPVFLQPAPESSVSFSILNYFMLSLGWFRPQTCMAGNSFSFSLQTGPLIARKQSTSNNSTQASTSYENYDFCFLLSNTKVFMQLPPSI